MIVMDIDDESSVAAGVASVLDDAGRIDVVVNNAGIALSGAIEDVSIDEAKAQFETNVFGAWRVCRTVLPIMRTQRSGLIINVSSIGGLIGLPFHGAYCSTKFALEGLSESLRLEARLSGVKVVLVEPGDVNTGMSDRSSIATKQSAVYLEPLQSSVTAMKDGEESGIGPEVVARTVARVVHSRQPRFRYTVGQMSQRTGALAKRLLPWSVIEYILTKIYIGEQRGSSR